MDKVSFICGMVTAFCECVAAGCKQIALSPPMERADFLLAKEECARIIERHGLRWFHEENADLPASVRRDWMVIYAREAAIRAYAQRRAAGESPQENIAPFADLLGYSDDRIVSGYDAYREYFERKNQE